MKNEDLKSKLIDIAAMKLDFPLSDIDIKQIADEITSIDDHYWYWCTFRESYLVCLFGNEDVDNKDNMKWLTPAQNCHTLKKLCDEFIFPMTTVLPRIIVIRTFPGMTMREHTDCAEEEINTLEPKLRLVVKGKKNNTLYFLNENNKEIHISEDWNSYIMSGASLHGMKNKGEEKYTICWGDPWVGDNLENQKFVTYITEQILKNGSTAIYRSSLGKVDHAKGVKDKAVEKIYSWNEWNDLKKN